MFFDGLKKEADEILQSVYKLPFIQELSAGVLSKKKFTYYLHQDRLYLNEFGRSLSIVGARMKNGQHAVSCLEFGINALRAEQAMHNDYLLHLGSPFKKDKASPSCFAYTNFLMKTCLYDPVEVGLAALLPCFWIYQKVGSKLIMNSASNNPYQQWIEVYGGHNFKASTQQIVNILNKLAISSSAQQIQEMRAAFIYSAKYEWLFWHSAYEQEKWSI